MFIFHISLDKAENFNERDKTLKDLKIPRIADIIPVMYLVCISPNGDQEITWYAKIMATACAVHANVMMGRHPMAAVPPHAHTQPHAHQGAAPKPHNVMLQQPRASG